MPASLQSASVSPTSTVLPAGLCTSFVETQSYPILSIEYHDGSYQRSVVIDGTNAARSLRTWTISRRLTNTQLSTLRTFWEETVIAGLRPFYAYPFPAVTDPTGVSTTGRVTVHFRGDWSETIGLGRADVPNLQLVEVA